MIPNLTVLAVILPYTLWSAFIGPDFAVGYRAYYVAAFWLLLAWDACARCLPGRSERLAFALSAIVPWSAVLLLWFSDAGSGQFRKYSSEYYVLTGSCAVGALQAALAAGYATWRGGKG